MALVVRDDTSENDALPKADSVVLDALPYVENLDPDYEQYAISLIEEELQNTVNEQRQPNGTDLEEHPALRRLLPSSSSFGRKDFSQPPGFGGRAPIASAAYESLAARQNSGMDVIPDDSKWRNRPDPMAEKGGVIEDGADEETVLSDLQTSIATSKIKLEQERMHLINLELYQQFETSNRWKDYHGQLEQRYVTPMTDAVAQQRLRVDGINAGRMEEQEAAARKLQVLNTRWEQLVDKNQRLGVAISRLEAEVEGLKEVSEM